MNGRMKKRRIAVILIFLFSAASGSMVYEAGATAGAEQAAAAPQTPKTIWVGESRWSYFKNMKRNFVRGSKNFVTSPLEIPITIQEYHEQAGLPLIRHLAGFADGTFRMIARAGSGLWDFFSAFLPGNQDGLPVKPETLF